MRIRAKRSMHSKFADSRDDLFRTLQIIFQINETCCLSLQFSSSLISWIQKFCADGQKDRLQSSVVYARYSRVFTKYRRRFILDRYFDLILASSLPVSFLGHFWSIFRATLTIVNRAIGTRCCQSRCLMQLDLLAPLGFQ